MEVTNSFPIYLFILASKWNTISLPKDFTHVELEAKENMNCHLTFRGDYNIFRTCAVRKFEADVDVDGGDHDDDGNDYDGDDDYDHHHH